MSLDRGNNSIQSFANFLKYQDFLMEPSPSDCCINLSFQSAFEFRSMKLMISFEIDEVINSTVTKQISSTKTIVRALFVCDL